MRPTTLEPLVNGTCTVVWISSRRIARPGPDTELRRFLVDDDEDLAGAGRVGAGGVEIQWEVAPSLTREVAETVRGDEVERWRFRLPANTAPWVVCSIGSSCASAAWPTSSGSLADARLAVSAATSRSRFSASAWRVMSLTVPTSSCSSPASSLTAEIETSAGNR